MPLFIVAAMMLGLGAEPQPPPPPGKVTDIELQALSARNQVRQAELVLTEKYYRHGKSVRGPFTISVWVDGKRARTDVVFDRSMEPAVREIHCNNCEFEDHELSYSEITGQVTHALFGRIKPSRNKSRQIILDPRVLGMFPVTCLNLPKKGPDSLVGRPDRQSTLVERSDWHGQECSVVSYQSLGRWQARIWIVPAYGNSVVRLEVSAPDDKLTDVLESEVAPFGEQRVWFPRRCLYTRTVDGREQEREELDIDVKSLNQAIDPVHFRLSDMALAPHTPIQGVPEAPAKIYEWRDSKIVAGGSAPAVVRGIKPSISPWYYAAGVSLAVLAVFLIWKAVRLRR